jgi:hypothetical protein
MGQGGLPSVREKKNKKKTADSPAERRKWSKLSTFQSAVKELALWSFVYVAARQTMVC